MRQMNKSLILLLCAFVSWMAHPQVWVATNSWNEQWEKDYETWVQDNWRISFFASPTRTDGSPNPYYGILMDCADTVYSMRLVYSFEKNLPWAMLDPTGGKNLISNKMTRFNSVGDRYSRMRSFLKYVQHIVSTRSMPNDTYPVSISRNTMRAGGLIATTKANHHSWTIQSMLAIGIPHLIYNSALESSTVTLQQRTSWPYPTWVFAGNYSPTGHAGVKYWRPIEYIQKPVWEVPGYSEEQYKIGLNNWTKLVQKRLATMTETTEGKLKRMLTNVCVGFQDRISYVNIALKYLRRQNYACMNYTMYDQYSSPSRDERIYDDLVVLRQAFKEAYSSGDVNQIPAALKAQLDKVYPYIMSSAATETARMQHSSVDSQSTCLIDYGNDDIDLAELKRRMYLGWMSNNPMDELEYRWGEKKGPSAAAARCPSWDVWTPDVQD